MNPPYPADLEAKGWSLDLDYERIEQSDTWAVASFEQRPWLLMVWLVSWRQVPVASLPNDDRLIAARLGMSQPQFEAWRDVLLSGWELASDGRFYHKTLTDHVLRMANKRDKDRARVAAYRARSAGLDASNACVTRDSTVCTTPTPTPTPEEQEHSLREVPATQTPAKPKAPGKAERVAQITSEAIAAYNAVMARPAGLLAAVRVGKEKRKREVERSIGIAREVCQDAFQSQTITPEFWTTYFETCAADDFLSGRGPYTNGHANWRPDFEYLTRPATIAKVYERAAGDE